MGRAKLKMKLIEKESSRMLSFKKRSEGLMKKLHQLTTLCGIGACMIITGPCQNQSFVWPPDNPDQVRRLIDLYISKNREIGGVKTYGLSDFFEDRQRKTLSEVCKLRKKNSEARYPTWSPQLEVMNESQLRELGAALQAKAHIVRSRIEFLNDLEVFKNCIIPDRDVNQLYPHHQDLGPAVDLPYFMPKNNEFASLEPPITYHAAPPMIEPHHYCVQPMQAPQPRMFWPMISSVAPPPNMHDSSMENGRWDYDDDVIRYLLPF